MYNAKSMKAEEFICHEEILDTLAYAEANKNNKELLEQAGYSADDIKSCWSRLLPKPSCARA